MPLKKCPSSPNCVCSLDSSEQHGIAPFGSGPEFQKVWTRLQKVMKSWPRTTLLKQTGTYLHYEVRSPLLGFKDDVEFELDAKAKAIQVRSASRIGYSDLGANRKRIEAIRKSL